MQESQHIEFKRHWKDEHLKWICAFANSSGGTLMLGYDDQGNPVGVDDARKLLVDIPNKVRDVLGIMVEVNLIRHQQLEALHIITDAYPYPVSYKGEYHYRSGSTKQELKGAALDKFLMRKHGITWDSVPVPHVKPSDLDPKTLSHFRRQAIHKQRLPDAIANDSDIDLLEKLRLMQGNYLKRAAIMLFHPEPDYFVTGAVIKVGAFGDSDADLRHHDEIAGNLFNQVDNALDVIQLKYLKASISYEGLYRKEHLPLPMPALREALLNAVVHKDYSVHTAIQISIYPDKLMLWNPGQLPDKWTLEKLLSKHESIPYNPEIANAFFRAGLIESWGRGIERMMEACEKEGYPAPEWKVEPNGVWVTFLLEAQQGQEEASEAAEGERLRPIATDYDRLRPITTDRNLSIEQVEVLRFALENQKLVRKDVVALLGLGETKAKEILNSLLNEQLLERHGHGRGTHYRLKRRQS